MNKRVLSNILRKGGLIIFIGLLISANFWQAGRAYVGGGTAYFTDYGYISKYNSFKYIVQNAPPNTCGTLVLDRNGVHEVTPNWICTNASGYAEKGPYSPTRDETALNIHIEWNDGTRTTGGEYHYQDITAPVINIDPHVSGGVGVPAPTNFYGTVKDTQWGPGLDFYRWSTMYISLYNGSTGKYYTPAEGCFCSTSRLNLTPTLAGSLVGNNIPWSISTPASAFNKTDTYYIYVDAKDLYYPASTATAIFYGPRP